MTIRPGSSRVRSTTPRMKQSDNQARLFARSLDHAADEANPVFADLVFEANVIVGPHDARNGPGEILESKARITGIAVPRFLGVLQAQLGDHAADHDLLIDFQFGDLLNFMARESADQVFVLSQRMAGDVEVEGFLFVTEFFAIRPFRDLG